MENYTYEEISKYLFDLIPKEEWGRLEGILGEMSPEFMGFCDTYYYLSRIIPKDYTVIDFGSGNNPQSYFFVNHRKFIAVNPKSDIEEESGMFCPSNCDIYRMTTGEFLRSVDYPKEKVFAICNYVPNWFGEDSKKLVKENFQNCYIFYP